MKKAIFALFSTLVSLGLNAAPGTLPGDASVDNFGGASYAIPLEVVPGSGGLQPKLSFVYRSGAGNGPLGVGWSVAGLSAITRMPYTSYLDATESQRSSFNAANFRRYGIAFSASDHFALDGQRLVAVAGTYGSTGSEYQTELDSFVKVTANGSAGTGPASFTVQTRDGLTLEFGHTADSRIEAPGRSEVLSWALNRVTDSVGNVMTISYIEENGTFYPDLIEYSYNGGAYNRCSVDFVYEAKPTSEQVPQFIAGAQIAITKRLSSVVVKDASTTVRTYGLSYAANGASTGYSRLQSIALSAGGDSFPATQFVWQDRTSHGFDAFSFDNSYRNFGSWQGSDGVNASFRQIDIDGNGELDFVKYVKVGSTYYAESWRFVPTSDGEKANGQIHKVSSTGISPWPGAQRVYEGDWNGDGRTDFLTINTITYGEDTIPWTYYADETITLYLSDGNAWVKGSSLYNSFSSTSGPVLLNQKLAIVDYNGDGRSDVLVTRSQGGNAIYRSTGGGLSYAASFGYGNANTYQTVDFNGDGMGDLFRTYQDGSSRRVVVNVSNGSGFSTTVSQNLTSWNNESELLPADVNGDGLTDLIHAYDSGTSIYFRVYYATGASSGTYFSDSGVTTSYTYSGNWSEHRHLPADVNGDGRMDMIAVYKSGSLRYNRVFLSDGKSLVAKGVAQSMGSWNHDDLFLPTDLDGDGKSDFVRLYNSSGTTYGVPYFSQGSQPDLITQVTNGLGAVSTFSYLPITRSSVYTRTAPLPSYPLVQIEAPLHVVRALGKDDGLGTPAADYITYYTYSDGLAHSWGYGFLGFHTVISFDDRRDIFEQKWMSQAFPTAGMVTTQAAWAPDPHSAGAWAFLGHTTDTLTYLSLNGGKTYFPYTDVSYTEKNEVSEDVVNPGPAYALIQVDNDFDSFGNLTRSLTNYWSQGGIWVRSEEVENTYSNNTGNWHLGRLTRAEVTATSSAGSQTRTSSFAYDATTGLLASETIEPDISAHRVITTYVRDSWGNITSEQISGTGITTRTTTYEYDATKRYRTKVTLPQGGIVTHSVYDLGLGVVSQETDPNGQITTYTHDPFGRPDLTTFHGYRTNVDFLGAGTLPSPDNRPYAYAIRTTPENGSGVAYAAPVTVYYDRVGRELRRQTLGGNGGTQTIYTDFLYDARGRLEYESEPYTAGGSPLWNRAIYDVLDRLRFSRKAVPTSQDSRGYIETKHVYNGLTTSVVSDHGGPNPQTTTTVANGAGQTVSVTDAAGNILQYEYDAFGNQTKVQTSDGVVLATMGYDIRGNKTSMSEPSSGSYTYGYNVLGQLTTQTAPGSINTTLTYDLNGRMTQKVVTQGSTTHTFNWTFDTAAYGKGQLASESSAGYSKTFVYDNKARLNYTDETVNGTTYRFTQSYDAYDRLETLTYPTGYQVRNSYDSAGRVIEVRGLSDLRIWWSQPKFDAYNRITEYDNGPWDVALTYQAGSGYLTDVRAWKEGIPGIFEADLAYTYDNRGNLTRRWNGSLVETFRYDNLNRLIGSQKANVNPSTISQSVFYDRFGNITTRDGRSYTYVAGKPHQLEWHLRQDGHWIYHSYDAQGKYLGQWDNNLGLWDRWMTWYEFGQPASLTTGSTTTLYYYDTGQRRVRDVTGSKERVYIGGLYEKETQGASIQHRHFIPTPTGTVGVLTTTGASGNNFLGGTARLFLGDHLGSNSFVIDEAGNTVAEYSFDAWGVARDATTWADLSYGTAWPAYAADRGFTGHQMLNEHLLVHMNGRIYDPYLGRFLSADPFVQSPGNLQNYNRYSYVLNNPLAFTDPSGHFFKAIGNFFKKFWKPIVAIVATVVTAGTLGPALAGWMGGFWASSLGTAMVSGFVGGFVGGFTGTILYGGSFGDALMNGLIGGAIGALTAGALHEMDKLFPSWLDGSPDTEGAWFTRDRVATQMKRMLGRGALQGSVSDARGGSFSKAFLITLGSDALQFITEAGAEWRYRWEVAQEKRVFNHDDLMSLKPTWKTASREASKTKGMDGVAVEHGSQQNMGIPFRPGDDSKLLGFIPQSVTHEHGPIMGAISRNIPGFNSLSVSHDIFATALEINSITNLITSQGTIPPFIFGHFSLLTTQSFMTSGGSWHDFKP